ncbi:MAG: hypothetical protein K0U93_01160 [Gammaproteobacteria bacterium]|nr:hypothetical protein [Gammaproteobacteria bacterium]
MSVLAQFLEQEGIVTTIVSLIRLHSEKVQPPRSLWVPYELGRPLGGPGDVATQLRVVREALSLLETALAPSAIVDFDAPPASTSTWTSPAATGAGTLQSEVQALEAAYLAAQTATGRTAVGVSGLSVSAIVSLIDAVSRDEASQEAGEGEMPLTLKLRYAIDDLKAYYLEAGAGANMTVTSDQLGEWFWRTTVAGKTLIALRAQLSQHERRGLQLLGTNFVVPRLWAERLGV